MPNIATALKSEIARVARKEVRGETQGLKKTIAPFRTEIAALKRRVLELERLVRKVGKVTKKITSIQAPDDDTSHRFSAKGLLKHRQTLGLSAKDVGILIGASALSVYKWERGENRPRDKHIAAIAQLRTMGKKAAAAKLAALAE